MSQPETPPGPGGSDPGGGDPGGGSGGRAALAATRQALHALKWSAAGAGTGLLALLTGLTLLVVTLLGLVGVGLALVRPALMLVRKLADLERLRLRALGHEVHRPYGPAPSGLREVWRSARTDPSTRRDLGWLATHGSYGLVLGILAMQLPVNAVRELTFPLWWRLAPPEVAGAFGGLLPVHTWLGAALSALAGFLWVVLWLGLAPRLLRWQARPGVRLLTSHPDIDLSERVAQLTATRAAALDAHAVELRRIERALHDGTQNRLVTVAVLTGAARQALARDPASAESLLERVQDSAEAALGELRTVIRSILPPVLEQNGLAGALTALAAACPVPTRVEVASQRCPAAVEASAYFAVAEALTNVARHSGATEATVTVDYSGDLLRVRVQDNGVGGAAVPAGSGLSGIARRAEALDGVLHVASPSGGPTVVEVRLPCGA